MGTHPASTVAEGVAFMQLIDGKPVDALSGERIDVACPSDGKVFASIPASGGADVDRAVKAARKAFDEGPWSRMPAVERGRCLTRLFQLVEKHGEELAALESRDTGKPVRQGRADVTATMRYYEFYGGAGDKIHGDTIPFLEGYTALTLREPHGVVGGIIPPSDQAKLTELGVARVYTPKDFRLTQVMAEIADLVLADRKKDS